MATNTLEPMMQFTTPLSPLHEMLVSMWNENNYIPSTTFNSSHRQVDIVFTKDGIRTLIDVVIVDPT
jgi:hypothetical protein